MTATITAASFPTPDAIQLSNNPAVRDQQARFAAIQAAGANEALKRLSSRLDGVSSELERQMVFIQTMKDLAEWRFRLAHQSEGRRPGALIEQYHTPIGIGRVRAPQLPQDIDLMAYVAGQDAFHAHVNRTQLLLTDSSAPVERTHQAPARNHRRTGGLERG